MYNTRNTSSDITVALMTPPITTVASGRCTSAPMPVLVAMGTKPNAATSVVISTGRRRIRAACSMACSRSRPRARSCRTVETSSMSSSTATPERTTNPTAAEMENGMSRTHRAINPPVQANGTPVNTRIVSTTLP